jgi:hypothetical protein
VPYINGLAVSADAGTMIVGLCVPGWCGGIHGVVNDQAETVLYRSNDGGNTWASLSGLTAPRSCRRWASMAGRSSGSRVSTRISRRTPGNPVTTRRHRR